MPSSDQGVPGSSAAAPHIFFPLLELHPELIVSLFEVLPDDDAVALALCSRLLLDLGSPLRPLPLYSRERHSLMLRLERDLVSTHVYCPECATLESYTARSLRAGEQSPVEREDADYFDLSCRELSFSPTKEWWRGGLDLGYHLVRFIMNQYLYGRVSDVTLDVFRGDPRRSKAPVGKATLAGSAMTTGRRWGRAWRRAWDEEWSVSVTASIIDRELYLRSTHVIEVPTDLGETWSPKRRHRVCNHCTVVDRYEDHWHKAFNRGRPGDLYSRTTSSCHMCLSDFTFEGRATGNLNVFTIEGFHALGSFLDDPMGMVSWKYRAFVGFGTGDLWLQDFTRAPMDEDFKLADTWHGFGSVRVALMAAACQDSPP